ncbi:hypothetical protein ABIE06_004679 [Pantoea dispersa]
MGFKELLPPAITVLAVFLTARLPCGTSTERKRLRLKRPC